MHSQTMNTNHLYGEESFKFVSWTNALYGGQAIFEILQIVAGEGR